MDLQAHQASGQLAASLWRTLVDNFFYSQNQAQPASSAPSSTNSISSSSLNPVQENPFNFPLNLSVSTPTQHQIDPQFNQINNNVQQLQQQQQQQHQVSFMTIQQQQQQQQQQHQKRSPVQTKIVNKPSKKRLIPGNHNNSKSQRQFKANSRHSIELDRALEESTLHQKISEGANINEHIDSAQDDSIDVEDEQDQEHSNQSQQKFNNFDQTSHNLNTNSNQDTTPATIATTTTSISTTSSSGSSSKQKRLYKCHSCTFETDRKSDYWVHIRIHMRPEKQLACELCQFVTQYKHHLEYHQRNHSGFKPFKCDHCDYSCVNKSMLNSHMKSHSSIYQYQCGDCKYVTKYVHSLKMHLRKYDHKPAQLMIDVYGRRRGPKSAATSNTNSNSNSKNNSCLNSPTGTPSTTLADAQLIAQTHNNQAQFNANFIMINESSQRNNNNTSQSSSCNLSVNSHNDDEIIITDNNNNNLNNLHEQNFQQNQSHMDLNGNNFYSQQQITNAINSILDLRVDSKFSDS